MADVQLGVEAHGRTADEVQAALATGSEALLAFLADARAERVRTRGVSVRPDLDQARPPGQPAQIVGYSGRVSVGFQVEAARLGAVLTGALGHGANVVDATGLRPREAEVDAARARLAADATRAALGQARAVAVAAGGRAGPVRSVVVEPAPGLATPLLRGAVMATAAPVATEAGDSEVSASVTATVALTTP